MPSIAIAAVRMEKFEQPMVDKFINYLRYEKNRSELTVTRYEQSLRDFQTFFEAKDDGLTWETVDADNIREWMEAKMDKGQKATTVNADLAALRTFFRFALSRNMVKRDPAHQVLGPKKQKPLPQFLRESEMNKLLDEMEWEDNYKDVRARTIILLFYETGLRRAELRSLNDVDVDLQACQLKVTGKRNKQRMVPFGEEMAAALQHYLEMRNREIPRCSEAFFVSGKGERMTEDAIYKDVKKHLSRVSTLKKRSPHVLRHTFATAMLNHDAGLESVRKLLGHESLETTEIYTHTTFDQLKRVYKEAHPRG